MKTNKKYFSLLCFGLIVIFSLSVISAGKDLVFVQGPNCDMKNIDFEVEYIGNSSISSQSIHVFVPIPSNNGEIQYSLTGTWSNGYLASGDIISFHSSDLGGFSPELNKGYKLYLDTNTVDGAWSDEVSFSCSSPKVISTGDTTCYYKKNGICEVKSYPPAYGSCSQIGSPAGYYNGMPLYSSLFDCNNGIECTNECGTFGAKDCSGQYIKNECGEFDSDICLDSKTTDCSLSGQICSNGDCIDPPMTSKDKEVRENLNGKDKNLSIFFIATPILIIILLGTLYLSKKRNKHSKLKIKENIEEVHALPEKETKEEISNDITEAITISGLGVKKGSSTILENVNFSIKRGEFVSLLGQSGSGKSTIIEILAGRRKPSNGKIKIFGKEFDKEEINNYLGFVPQGNEIYLNQTVLQNLENSAIKWGIKNSKEKIFKVLEQINLDERKDLIASKLSGGQQKLLSLGMELIREPELLILDEPTTGLDPNTRNQIITILCNLSRYNKKTILITTHFMDDSEECDEVLIINNKKVAASGSPEKLKKMLPGSGKMVTLVLDNSAKELLEKIRKIKGVDKVIAEGRTLNILANNPNAIEIANKIHELGGYVNESKISKATMKEVFVFFTGKNPEE